MFQENQITEEYTNDGCVYQITDTKEFHSRLRNDAAFSQAYFATSTDPTEFVAVESELKEHGQQNFEWSDKATNLLVEAYKERKDLFRDPKVKKKHLWSEIQREMSAAGFQVEHHALDRKMRNMKCTYRKIKDNTSKGSKCRILWKYFDAFEELFEGDHTVNGAVSNDSTFFEEDYETSADSPEFVAVEEGSEFEENSEQDQNSFKWSDTATTFFLKAYEERKDRFRDRKISNKCLWNEILQEMNVAGFQVEHEQALDRKMRNMTGTYKRIKDSYNKGSIGRISWKHFNTFEKIFEGDHTVNCNPASPPMESSETDDSAASCTGAPSSIRRQHRASSLYKMRKKYLAVEERKVKALNETNRLLAERNDLLRELIRSQQASKLSEAKKT